MKLRHQLTWPLTALLGPLVITIAACQHEPQSPPKPLLSEDQEWNWAVAQFDRTPIYVQIFLKKHPGSQYTSRGREMLARGDNQAKLARITSTDAACNSKIARAVESFSADLQRHQEYFARANNIAIPSYKISIPSNFFTEHATYAASPIGASTKRTEIEFMVYLDIVKNEERCAIVKRWDSGVGLPECTCEFAGAR